MGCTQNKAIERETTPVARSMGTKQPSVMLTSPTTLDSNRLVVPESRLSTKVDYKITVAQRTKTLNLADERLQGVPEPLLKLKGLKELDLQSNALTSFVPLEEPSTLRKLNLANNRLLTVPRLAFSLLEKLDLSCNRLTFFPDFSGMPALRELYLDHNKLGCVPVGESFPPNLVILDLSYNLFTALPAQLGKLSALRDLNLSSNVLMSFAPGSIAKGMKNLQHLDVSNNKISDLPDELFADTALSSLLLKNNPVKEADLLKKDSYEAFLVRKAAAGIILSPLSPKSPATVEIRLR